MQEDGDVRRSIDPGVKSSKRATARSSCMWKSDKKQKATCK